MRYIFFLVFLSNLNSLSSQDLEGLWTGRIDKGFRINVTIDSTLSIDFPGLPGMQVSVLDHHLAADSLSSRLKLIPNSEIDFNLVLKEGGIAEGIWQDVIKTSQVRLVKVDSFPEPIRTQLPESPFPYKEEELLIHQTVEDFYLSGTMTVPHGVIDPTVVILISGSGVQNRNSELMGHKPFALIADYLSRQGICVFRYDDRGAGKSSGAYFNATTADFAHDVLSIVDHLDSLGFDNIGLLGHSEGSMVATLVGAQDKRIDFLISFAGPAIPIAELMVIQNGNLLVEQGFDKEEVDDYLQFLTAAYQLIDVDTPKDSIYDPLKELCFDFYDSRDSIYQKIYSPSKMLFYAQHAGGYLGRWFRYFINHEPAHYIEQLSCPVLALNGTMDIQVPAEENLAGFETHLSRSAVPYYEVIALDSINHIFQKVDDWNVYEYYESAESVNVKILELLTNWIKRLKN